MIHLRKSILFCLILCGAFFQLPAQVVQNSLEISRILFEDSLQHIQKKHHKKVADLGTLYVERLDAVKIRYQAMGDLDGVLQVEAQQSAVHNGEPPPLLFQEGGSELEIVKGQYDAALQVLNQDIETKTNRLKKVYISHLKTLQSNLTRGNRIDEALAVRDEVGKMESDSPISQVDSAQVSVPPEKRFLMEWGMPQRRRQVLVTTKGLQLKPNLVFGRNSRLDRDGILLEGGRVFIEGMDEELYKAVQDTGQWTLTAELIPEKALCYGPGRILSYLRNDKRRNFSLGQEGDRLILRLRTSETDQNGTHPQLDLGELKAGSPTKVVFSYSTQGAVCYRDGESVTLEDLGGDFSVWSEMPLLLGSEAKGDRAWTGRILSFSLSNQVLSPAAAKAASK